ncbi:MAG TPA: glycosyltransferase family 4 protein [Rhodanobacteraceae bacterium]|nr:glycosyltransferase family 4 protein [Rhodanobacteraceae bacterium]
MDADFTALAGEPHRILMTCDTVGGVWRYAIDLSRALCLSGNTVTLAAMGPAPSRAQQAEAAAIDGLTLRSRACRLIWMDDPWRDVREAGDWLLRLAEEVRPDLVHANDFGHVALAWPAPVLCVAHSCVASWWRAVHRVEAPPQWDRYRAHVRSALLASDIIVAPSRAMAAALQTEYGPLRGIRVIPNGTHGVAPANCKKRELIFAAGRLWDEAKNLNRLAAIAPGVPWPIYIAGQDCAPDGARATLFNVNHLGVLRPAAMQRWFARAAIYALPARYEPFGLSILEAAQAGCALVLGDIPSLREFWEGAALFAHPDDGDALRDALLRLIDDDALRARFGARARRRAMFMTAVRMADEYLALYDGLLPSPSGRGVGDEGPHKRDASILRESVPSPGASRSRSARVRSAPPLPVGEGKSWAEGARTSVRSRLAGNHA